ncbi:MAG: hypothetical protein KJO95_07640 [Gammaproteobacteria bacterium]|nr:hypothetical protein [Gammaproteobacteria bacterium]MBU2676021.1 hypothetical protein [Gammaproteobacteria bacterium]NNC56114.1 hypothetical protein [Woeseiaceae bacterium]NNL49757.1 hypothetical protein [Woeseiaceae bacterium]
MRNIRNTSLKLIAAVATIPLLTFAQEVQDPPIADDKTIEEVVVYGPRSGDPVDIDALYVEQLRKRVLDDYFEQQRLMERARWRSSLDIKIKSPSRIRWGYDPGAELRMRRETDLMDLPFERTRPASVLRFEF